MMFRKKLEDKIKKKGQEIQELEGKMAEAKAYLQGLQEALKMLPREEVHGKSAETLLRPGSTSFKTLKLLEKTGSPLHISEILPQIGESNEKKERVSLGGSLARYVRKGEIFTRTAPNTFGLVSWGNSTEAGTETMTGAEPPDDFGDIPDEIPF